MKKLLVIFTLFAFLMTGNLFAQDSKQEKSKNQNRNKNQQGELVKEQKQNQEGQVVKEQKQKKTGEGFVDEDGDGINDNKKSDGQKEQKQNKKKVKKQHKNKKGNMGDLGDGSQTKSQNKTKSGGKQQFYNKF